MAVACGEGFTSFVTEQGDVWACGKGDDGQLGLGSKAHQLLPVCVNGAGEGLDGKVDELFDGEAVVMVAAGSAHTACVTAKGTLWIWGDVGSGRLGHGDIARRQRPHRLEKELYGGSPAVMVSCGFAHTLVLTAAGLLWSCGYGGNGQLGHDDTANKLVMTLVGSEEFRGAHIVMVAAGRWHSIALGEEGRVWTWGCGRKGRLGHNDQGNRLVPTLLCGDFGAVMVAAGGFHTVAVTSQGELWAWGTGEEGQLGLGDASNRLVPALVGTEVAFGGSQVLTVSCGGAHTLAATRDGSLFSWGRGFHGTCGHNDSNNRLVPSRIDAQHFHNAKIVSATAGYTHSAAVTEEGALYTWGEAWGLGHGDGARKSVPTKVAPHLLQGARVGRCHGLPPMHALAFAMGTHVRLGSSEPTALSAGGSSKRRPQRQQGKAPAVADQDKDCEYVTMPGELVQRVVEACVSWPEGQAGELEGVLRLLGGGMMKARGSL